MIDVIINKNSVLMECPYCLSQVKVGALVCKCCKAKITEPSNADFRYCVVVFLVITMIYAVIVKTVEKIFFLEDVGLILRPLSLILIPCLSLYFIRRKNKKDDGVSTKRYTFTRY